MQRRTGYQLGTGYDFPIGTAEIREAACEESEFGIGEGYPHDYTGKTPPCERNVGVGQSY